MSENKGAKRELQEMYQKRCMLTGIREKTMTFHHIDKKEFGGKSTVENGALIIQTAHSWLHNDIEQNDIELLYLINECLQLYKQCLLEHREELIGDYQREVMPEVLKRVKRKTYGKKSNGYNAKSIYRRS